MMVSVVLENRPAKGYRDVLCFLIRKDIIMRKPTSYYDNPPPADFTGIPVFADAAEGMEWIKRNRWGKSHSVCPDCGHYTDKFQSRKNNVKNYLCKNDKCGRSIFNPLTGTALEGTQLPIHYWIFAAREFNKSHLGLSTRQLADALDVPLPTAVKMYQRLGQLFTAKNGGILGEFAPKHADMGKHPQRRRKPTPRAGDGAIIIPAPKKPKKLCKRWSEGGDCRDWEWTTVPSEDIPAIFDEESSAQFFTQLLWGNGVKCPDCESLHIGRCSRVGFFRCYNKECKRDRFNFKTNTPLMNSKLSMKKWGEAMYEMTIARQGTSALELMNRIHVSYKTAFYLFHRLRLMSVSSPDGTAIGPLEVDELFISVKKPDGGKPGNPFHMKTGKAIIGARCRTTGKSYVEQIDDLNAETALDFINRCTGGRKVTVFTDGWLGYQKSVPQYGHHHEYTNHSNNEYARPSAWKIIHEKEDWHKKKRTGNIVHSNSVESMWRQMRAAVVGVYRKMSMKYLMSYMSEVAFRLDEGRVSRDIGSRIAAMYLNGVGKRITYASMVSQ